MIKKKLGMFIAPVLLLGLTACNNDADNAMDPTDGNPVNTVTNVDDNLFGVNNRYPYDHQGLLAEDYNNDDNGWNNRNGYRMNTTTNREDNAANMNNRYPFDHQGPLTEDYDNDRDNNDRNDRTTRTNGNRAIYRNNDGRNNKDVTNRDNNRNNPNISSYRTSKNSNSYPHTRAVLIQEARYQFIPVNPNQDSKEQARLRKNNEVAQTPAVQQQLQQQAQALMQQQARARQQQLAQAPQQQQAQAQQQQQAQAQQQQQAQAQQQQQAQAPKQQQQAQAPKQQQTQATPANISQAVQQVIDLTNAQRKQNGLPALQADTKLISVAQKKSDDMQQKGYFSHTSPTYGSPFDMMRDFGVTYRSAGENIAQGQRTPQEVVQAWMNSEGHRKNILSRDFTHIGVGYESAGNHWTQMFIGK